MKHLKLYEEFAKKNTNIKQDNINVVKKLIVEYYPGKLDKFKIDTSKFPKITISGDFMDDDSGSMVEDVMFSLVQELPILFKNINGWQDIKQEDKGDIRYVTFEAKELSSIVHILGRRMGSGTMGINFTKVGEPNVIVKIEWKEIESEKLDKVAKIDSPLIAKIYKEYEKDGLYIIERENIPKDEIKKGEKVVSSSLEEIRSKLGIKFAEERSKCYHNGEQLPQEIFNLTDVQKSKISTQSLEIFKQIGEINLLLSGSMNRCPDLHSGNFSYDGKNIKLFDF